MKNSEPIISLDDLTVVFPGHPVFQNLNLTVNHGDFISIVGENGVGKTTLMRTILSQLAPTSGQVSFYPDAKHVKIGYVPQFRTLDSDYPLSIRDFVSLNFAGYGLPWLKRQEKQTVEAILKETQLMPIASRTLGHASGGERQKAYLAQALVQHPDLLILDESTASLDPKAKMELLDLVTLLNQTQGLTVIFVTHDVAMAKKYTSASLIMTREGTKYESSDQIKDEQLWRAQNV